MALAEHDRGNGRPASGPRPPFVPGIGDSETLWNAARLGQRHVRMERARERARVWERHEIKYLISEALAVEIRSFCRAHLPLDSHSACQPDHQYPVHSIYFDSADGQLLRSTLERRTNRVKLRVRTYRRFGEPDGTLPAFFEIKRKSNGLVRKTRARLPRHEAEPLTWNGFRLFRGSTDYAPSVCKNVNEFLSLRHQLGARPAIGVFYTREAYENHGIQGTRINIDRNLHYGLVNVADARQRGVWWPVPMRGVILEIKFANTFPAWVSHLIRETDLCRRGVCKYVMCFQAGKSLYGAKGVRLPV
ncbi:MAG: polyphosphate polymerase domain-containing protein [Phycisphaerae bacterium]